MKYLFVGGSLDAQTRELPVPHAVIEHAVENTTPPRITEHYHNSVMPSFKRERYQAYTFSGGPEHRRIIYGLFGMTPADILDRLIANYGS